MTGPVSIRSGVRNSCDASQPLVIQRSIYNFCNSGTRTGRECVRAEKLTPHVRQKHEVIREPEILLRDLQLRYYLRLRHRAEERMKRLTRLKVDWTILDL